MTDILDFDWLRARLSEPSHAAQWTYVLELGDVLAALKGVEGIVPESLTRFYERSVEEMHRAQRGNSALSTREMQMRGAIAGGVMFLENNCGYDRQTARTLIAKTAVLDRDRVVSWHKAALKAPDTSIQQYKLSDRWAAEQMAENLRDLAHRFHNSLSAEEIIAQVFSPVARSGG